MYALKARSDSRQQQPHPSVSPIRTLPAELMREIILLSTRPYHQPRTISISHISSMWRDVCLSCTSLFVEGDWDEWPVWLLELWCARANGRQLNIQLHGEGMRRLMVALRTERESGGAFEGTGLLTLLNKTRSSWSTLITDCDTDPSGCGMDDSEHEKCGTFLLANTPQLVDLSYSSCYSTEPLTFSSWLPNLRQLDLCNFILDSLAFTGMPLLSIITLAIDDIMTDDDASMQVSSWAKWLSGLSPSSTLKELRIRPLSFDSPPIDIPEIISLLSIELLEIQDANDMDVMGYLFGCIQFPNLHSCTLIYIGGWRHADHPSWLSENFGEITTAAPRLSALCIRLSAHPIALLEQACQFMHALSDKSTVPCLSSLEIVDSGAVSVREEDLADFLPLKLDTLNALRELVDSRQLVKLSLPVISAAWIAEIGPKVGNFTAQHVLP